MRILRLIGTFIKVNLQMALAYRADTAVQILVNLMWLGWELLGIRIIFSNTTTLAGWGMGQLIALLGVFRLVNTLMFALVWPNTEKFNASIRDGTFDYTLLQPMSSLFLVSFSRIVVWRVWEVALAIALVVVGLGMGGGGVQAQGVLGFVLLTASGSMVIYSLWIAMIALTFWFTKFDNNVTLLHALMDAGRYPSTVYPSWLRLIITFIVPIALATTVPLQALRGDLSPWQVALFLGVGVVSFLAARLIWNAGVHKYGSTGS